MKFKKTSAALLVATMAITGASYAWADESLVDNSEDLQQTSTEETTENSISTNEDTVDINEATEEAVLTEGEETEEIEVIDVSEVTAPTESEKEVETESPSTDLVFPAIPEGYTAGNLVALQKAFENAGNDTAKAAIARNAQRAIAKFEAKQAAQKQEETTEVENEVIVEETKVEEQASTEQSTTVVPAAKTEKAAAKEARKTLQVEHKTERQALQKEQKAEKQALKEKK